MPALRHLAWLLPLLSLSGSAVAEPTMPSTLWVASIPATALDAAFATGAVVRGRLPGALVVADAGSAAALAAAGHAVDGPLRVTPGADVLLLTPGRGAEMADLAEALDLARANLAPGVRVLWTGTAGAIVETDRPLPTSEPFLSVRPHVLSSTPLPRPPAPDGAAAAPPTLRATAFDPAIDTIAATVDSVTYFPWIRRLSGAESVIVGGNPVTFVTRQTLQPQCDLAEQYVYERFQAMGFDQVAYDPYTLNGTTARNVIATQPGAQTPEQVVIVCGHLDSTSPSPATNAPGANDNGSGMAAVLLAAEVMRPYTFRCTVRYVAFTGEEQGLYGSEHYAALVAASTDSVVGVVNLDMIAWWGTRRRVDIEGESFCSPIMQVMNDACARYTSVATMYIWNPWGSDHVPFSNRGMRSFLAIESDYSAYPCYHRTCDTWDRNYGGFGAEIARATIATAAQLAGVVSAVSAPVASVSARAGLEAWPTPFDDAVSLRVAIPSAVRELAIHDVSGRLIRTLLRGPAAPGAVVTWDGRTEDGSAAPAGIYFVRLVDDAQGATRKLVRMR